MALGLPLRSLDLSLAGRVRVAEKMKVCSRDLAARGCFCRRGFCFLPPSAPSCSSSSASASSSPWTSCRVDTGRLLAPGILSRIEDSSEKWPCSVILSASSSTRKLSRSSWSRCCSPSVISSHRRPGVATTTSGW